jgi:hypothetical protein
MKFIFISIKVYSNKVYAYLSLYVTVLPLSAHLYLLLSSPVPMAPILMNSKNTEINSLQECLDGCHLRQVIVIRIWLDTYEDDIFPWVLSNIHIQQLASEWDTTPCTLKYWAAVEVYSLASSLEYAANSKLNIEDDISMLIYHCIISARHIFTFPQTYDGFFSRKKRVSFRTKFSQKKNCESM